MSKASIVILLLALFAGLVGLFFWWRSKKIKDNFSPGLSSDQAKLERERIQAEYDSVKSTIEKKYKEEIEKWKKRWQ